MVYIIYLIYQTTHFRPAAIRSSKNCSKFFIEIWSINAACALKEARGANPKDLQGTQTWEIHHTCRFNLEVHLPTGDLVLPFHITGGY